MSSMLDELPASKTLKALDADGVEHFVDDRAERV